MASKFAIIDFIKNKEEINVKRGLIKKMSEKIFDGYIKKFNPFVLIPTNLLDAEGYYVSLPIEKDFAYRSIGLAEDLLDRTLISLYDLDVRTAIIPREFSHVAREGIIVARKEYILPYFLMEIIEKGLKIVKKDLKTAEIILIADDLEVSACCVDMIYSNVNFLSVLAKDKNSYEYFKSIQSEIFNDCGLNLQVFSDGKEVIKSADIIIDTSSSYKSAYYYKKDAIFIDLSGNYEKFRELFVKRQDMIFINNITVRVEEQKFKADEFFMYMYTTNRDFRRLNGKNHIKIAENISKKNIKLSSILCENVVLKV
ncbi:MAG: hypothetical protein FWD82_03305 [Defluviitaleaceae bacterium]|nr:hypothetical protein [Defluviitaleaceae bacterium]